MGRATHFRLSRRRHQRHRSARSTGDRTRSSSSRPGTRRWPPSWPAPTPSSPARSACAWRPRGPAPSTCSTVSTTPRWITSRWSPSSASRRAPRSGGHYQQEVDLTSLFKDVAGRVRAPGRRSPAQVRHLVDRAVRIAMRAARRHLRHHSQRSAGMEAVEEPPRAHGTHSPASATASRGSCRTNADLQRAAEVLNSGKKVAMLVGAGRLGATEQVIAVADKLGAGVAKALLGKAVAARRSALRDRFDRPAGHQAELGHDDGLRHPPDGRVGLSLLRVPAQGRPGPRRADRHRRAHARHPLPAWRSICEGDGAETLEALLPLLERKDDRNWREQIADGREGLVGTCSRRGPWTKPIRSIRSACSGSCRRACRTTAS